VLILWGAVIAGGYANQGWLTFRQALAAGGCVRKGEQGVTVCFADRFTPEAEKQRAGEAGDGEGDQSSLRGSDDRRSRAIPFLKRFVVFNVAQCDGLPDAYSADAPPLPEREVVPVAETLISATGADFRIGGPRAFYSPSQDFVQVPPQPAFAQQIDLYEDQFVKARSFIVASRSAFHVPRPIDAQSVHRLVSGRDHCPAPQSVFTSLDRAKADADQTTTGRFSGAINLHGHTSNQPGARHPVEPDRFPQSAKGQSGVFAPRR
jgi:hypothetical protein